MSSSLLVALNGAEEKEDAVESEGNPTALWSLRVDFLLEVVEVPPWDMCRFLTWGFEKN